MIKFICYPKCTTCQKVKKWLDDNKIDRTFQLLRLGGGMARADLHRDRGGRDNAYVPALQKRDLPQAYRKEHKEK